MGFILLVVSLLPVFLIANYIYKRDQDKEPLKLLLELFMYGALSCFGVVIVSSILKIIFPVIFAFEADNSNLILLLIQVFIGVALIEESFKWIITYRIGYYSKYLDHIYDPIVYAVFTSLGFAALENVFYVASSGLQTGILRAILSIPGHACDGIFMGYFLGLAKEAKINKKYTKENIYIVLSLFIPIILHGIYDYCIMANNIIFFWIFILFIILLYIISLNRVKNSSRIMTSLIPKANYCPNCGNKVDGIYCPNCGRKND